MKKLSPFRLLLLVAIVVSLQDCASLTTKPDATKRTPLEIAELTYVQGSYFYEAGMQSAVALRASHRLSDQQWSVIESAQTQTQKYAPIYASMLKLWRDTGLKPSGFEANAARVKAAADILAAILVEVNR